MAVSRPEHQHGQYLRNILHFNVVQTLFNPELTSQPANLNTANQRMCFIIINYSLWRELVGGANAKQKSFSLANFVGGSACLFEWGVRTIKWPKVCEQGQQIVTIMVTWSKKLTSFQHCKPETIQTSYNETNSEIFRLPHMSNKPHRLAEPEINFVKGRLKY